MRLRVAINGFGRIGRMVCRRALEVPELELVAINATYPAETLAHLLQYDTVHGRYHLPVTAAEGSLHVGDHRIRLVGDRDPANLPWRELDVDLVVEATGKFRARDGAARHLLAGARWVLITAPAKGEVDATLVYGVNHTTLDPDRHQIISGASCTTNCLAPVVKVLDESFTLVSGLMTTVHSFTSSQKLLDNPHRDLRRARGVSNAIIPTDTGAAKAIKMVLPHLEGKLNGMAMRIPTPNVSVVDLTARFARPVSVAAVNDRLRAAAEGELKGILSYTEAPLVSADFNGDPHSSIVDGSFTLVAPDNLVKVIAWYDNEWGYSCRLVDLAAHVARVRNAAVVGQRVSVR